MTDYINNIKKTGFILENKIVEELKRNDWHIISNKFYEDDLVDTVREMDILAYKVSKVDDVDIFTTLLISCKKSEENAWILLSRNIDLNELNSNWWPLHIWTNDVALNEYIKEAKVNKSYYKFIYETKKIEIMQPPKFDVFAFQEMSIQNGKPQNDKNIFSSITTLMKAQSYEMGLLEGRKKNKSLYQFNLISVIDSELIRLNIEGDDIKDELIDTEQLVTRYIIRKKEQFFRIRFIKASVFKNYINSYNKLHVANIQLFKKQRAHFLKDSIKDHTKVDLLKSEFANLISDEIYRASNYHLNKDEIIKNILIVWESYKSKVRIFVSEDSEICTNLNSDSQLQKKTKECLNSVFRYDGEFEFETDPVPF